MTAARILGLAAVALGLGCAGPATSYKFPKRDYEASDYEFDGAAENGLLWGESSPDVIADNRSRRLGDLVIVSVEEKANADGSATTKTSRSTSMDAGITNFFGLMKKLAKKHPNIDPTALVSAVYDSTFDGNGETTRAGTLTATIPCQVKKVLPNGDLFIEGTKTIQINAEETHLYLSGVVRPYDIDMSNTVSSGRVLDARIDFSGHGVVSGTQRPGLLQRGMDVAWPL